MFAVAMKQYQECHIHTAELDNSCVNYETLKIDLQENYSLAFINICICYIVIYLEPLTFLKS